MVEPVSSDSVFRILKISGNDFQNNNWENNWFLYMVCT